MPDLIVYVTPVPASTTDEGQRQQALPLLAAVPVNVSALPTDQPPEVNDQATQHIVYDTEWLALPAAKKTQLLGLLSSDKSDIVIIATPATTQAQLTAILSEAAGDLPISADKNVELPNGTASSVEASSFAPHRALLPALLLAHDDNTLGFSNIQGGGVVVAKASTGETTAVQWTLDSGRRVVTLLGYWRPSK